MNNLAYIGYAFRFVLLVLVQVLIVNDVHLHYYLNPYIYPLLILMMPLSTPHWLLMVLGLFLGLSVDAFSNSLGMHAGGAVFLAFLRPFVVDLLTPKNGYETDDLPNIFFMGFGWFVAYSGILLFCFHLFYFYLEVLNLNNVPTLFLKAIGSTSVSLVLVILFSLLFGTKKKR